MNDARVLKFAESVRLSASSVEFSTADKKLEGICRKAEKVCSGNIVQFTPSMRALVEGGGYSRVYTETQPMGGEMYAKRDMECALNNQLLFLLTQRNDGRLAGAVINAAGKKASAWRNDPVYLWSSLDWLEQGLVADYGQLQGNALPHPAFKLYFLLGKPKEYLQLLAECLEAYDEYLWRTRDPYREGVLQTWCEWDTGEDNCSRFGFSSPTRWPHDVPPDGPNSPDPANPVHKERYYLWQAHAGHASGDSVAVPIRSMDMMAYSFENRMTRALISRELGDGKEGFWTERAMDVRRSFAKNLWRPERGAAYDKGRDNKFMDILVHNNLRCMWYGLFDKAMADEFVERHLLNPEEFFTPVPLVSIAANDPHFQNVAGNNWSGQPQGLTWQRLIRALENYGRYSNLTMFGRKYLKIVENAGEIIQQFDPYDPENPGKDNKGSIGYGPTALGLLEYFAKLFGVHVERDVVSWSGLMDAGATRYVQKLGSKTFALSNDGARFSGSVDGVEAFSCSGGVRVCTDMNGEPSRVVGIDAVPRKISFKSKDGAFEIEVAPDQIWNVSGGRASLMKA